jgi:chaperone required for assembly of F1-ATPase
MTHREELNGKAKIDFAEMIRKHVQDRPLPKRFYKKAAFSPVEGGYAITLDGRTVKTPLKSPLSVRSRALAEALAAEWEAQETHIDPAAMPLTRLTNTAIDRVLPDPERIVEEIVAYAQSDLLCYRADGPEPLVERQDSHWNPILDWAADTLGARLVTAVGIIHRPQPEEAIVAVRRHLQSMDADGLTAVHNMTTLSGSAVVAIAVAGGHISSEQGWTAAHVDEDWQAEQWGHDEAARRRQEMRRAEFLSAFEFLQLSRAA